MPKLASPSSTRVIEQAIFTSVQGRQNHGYQLASWSPGLSEARRRELVLWGPSHDSLNPGVHTALSFFRLKEGPYILAKTTAAGDEYSHRGGPRLYTQFLAVPSPIMDRFSWQPFRVHEALVGGGHARLMESLPEQLEPIRLIGRASPVQIAQLQQTVHQVGVDSISRLLHAAIGGRPLALIAPFPAERLFGAAIDLLPWKARESVSFTAGLRHSPRRPFRWYALSSDPKERQRLLRQSHQVMVDLSQASSPGKTDAWTECVSKLLRQSRWDEIPQLVDRSKGMTLAEACELARSWA